MKKIFITLLLMTLLSGCSVQSGGISGSTSTKSIDQIKDDYKQVSNANKSEIINQFVNNLKSKEKIQVLNIAYRNETSFVTFIKANDNTMTSLVLYTADNTYNTFYVRYKRLSEDGKYYIKLVDNINNGEYYVVDIYLPYIKETVDQARVSKNNFQDNGVIDTQFKQ